MKISKYQGGFTLLYAVLVSGIALVVGVGVFNVVAKQIELSGIGRESQAAFYAADTGVECALYWDVSQKIFSASNTPNGTPACANSVANWVGAAGVSTWDVTLDNGTCTSVRITKSSSPNTTTILSKGFSEACDSTNFRKVERSIEATY